MDVSACDYKEISQPETGLSVGGMPTALPPGWSPRSARVGQKMGSRKRGEGGQDSDGVKCRWKAAGGWRGSLAPAMPPMIAPNGLLSLTHAHAARPLFRGAHHEAAQRRLYSKALIWL